MRRAEGVAQIVIIRRVLVGVVYDKPNGTACRFALEDTAQKFNPVTLVAPCGYAALSRTAPVKLLLNEAGVDADACRHAVYHPSNGFSVTFAERCKRENVTESIPHHPFFVSDSVRIRIPRRLRGGVRSLRHDYDYRRNLRRSDLHSSIRRRSCGLSFPVSRRWLPRATQ